MLPSRVRPLAWIPLAFLVVPSVQAADPTDKPTDNPVATFYSGPEGYPAWTDSISWKNVINMKTYAKGKNEFEKFEKARDELSEGGGVLYYPAGTYDFTKRTTKKEEGRGLMLPHDVIIRGEAPAGHPLASDGKLVLTTKFIFPYRERGGGKVPSDWNFIGLQVEKKKTLKNSTDHIGIAWVHLVGAGVAFGPQVDWGKSWTSAADFKVKKGPDERMPDGTHPFDGLAGGGKKYLGAGHGRLVFGCVIEDAPPLDDFSDPGYGPNGFSTQRYWARIAVYGSRVLVANNYLPRSQKNFTYSQRTTASKGEKDTNKVQFDYGKTLGIDVNKELLIAAREDGTSPGYFEPGVVVRDNWVFNHGHTGYSLAGNWVTIAGNHNERAVLHAGEPRGTVLTLNGYDVVGPDSDSRSRAFDLAGRNLWVHNNHSANTGTTPGIDREAIVGRNAAGTPIFSWAITRNVHKQGNGPPGSGFMGGIDADCHGLLIGWNETSGAVGNRLKRKDLKMTDCAFVANKCEGVVPDANTLKGLGLPAPQTGNGGLLVPPTKVTATPHETDAVKITWAGPSEGAVGFRVDRRIAGGPWLAIAYRPPRPQADDENPQEWIDFTAPSRKELTYRVVALASDDGDKGASKPTEPVTLGGPAGASP